MTHVVDAPRALVFEAHTSPEHVPHWLTGPEGWTMPVCEIDLRPGGEWHFVWRRDDGSEMDMRGEYREVEPPARLVNTESWGADWPRDAQHAGPRRGGRPDDDHQHDPVSVPGRRATPRSPPG